MIKSYFKTSLRHLIKNRVLSIINIIGLSVAIGVCIIAYLFVQKEFSYDHYHKDKDKIFLYSHSVKTFENNYQNYLQWHDLTNTLREDIKQITEATAFKSDNTWVKYDNKQVIGDIGIIDSCFFKVFDSKFLYGSNKSFYNNKLNVVLTKSFAKKISNTSELKNLIGNLIQFPNEPKKFYTISAIIEDFPELSSIKFDIFINIANANYYSQWQNDFGNCMLYVKIDNEENKKHVESLINSNIPKYYEKNCKTYKDENLIKDPREAFKVKLINIVDTYLSKDFNVYAYQKKGNINYVYVIIGIASLLMILAIINYIMLVIGISLKRFKEIAIRKVIGSYRRNIIYQILIETSIITILSIIIGLLFGELFTPYVSNLINNKLVFTIYSNSIAILFLFTLFIIIVLFISIPGIFISKQNAVKIFRNKTKVGENLNLAKGFIIVQYTLAIILVICTTFISKQVNYMKNMDVGFNPKNIVSIALPSDYKCDKSHRLKERMKSSKYVENVTCSERDFIFGRSTLNLRNDKNEKLNTRYIKVEKDFLKTLEIKLLEGRDFNALDNIDSVTNIIINEKLAKTLNYKNPVGRFVSRGSKKIITYKIIGVVKDFHFDSMRQGIEPLYLLTGGRHSYNYTTMFAKIKPQNISLVLAELKRIWSNFESQREFNYSFLDKNLQKQYLKEERWAKVIGIIAIFAIIISSMGLFGLTMLLLNKKIKEIGIRKVNGANQKNIMLLINKEFAIYVLFAFIISVPISYYAIDKWLDNFYNKIPISVLVFILGALFVYLIVVFTISWQTIRAVKRNPVKSLRYE